MSHVVHLGGYLQNSDLWRVRKTHSTSGETPMKHILEREARLQADYESYER